MAGPSDVEQLLLEYVNDARLDPVGDAARYIASFAATATSADSEINSALNYFGVSGTAYLTALQALTPAQPVAWNDSLAAASRTHDQAMIAADSQSHQLPGEDSFDVRDTKAGYTGWSALGENIYAYADSALYAHAGFMVDWGSGPGGMQAEAGHRVNIMNPLYREVGVGIVAENDSSTAVGPLVVTQDFGTRVGLGQIILGVAYDDTDGDDFYSLGEGSGTLKVTVGGQSATSTASGGYTLDTSLSGKQVISFSGGGLVGTVTAAVTLAAASNIKIDIVSGDELKTSTSAVVAGAIHTIEGLGVTGLALTATGSSAHDLIGGAGNDTLTGGSGADTLAGGVGINTLIGGKGDDVYLVDSAADVVREKAGEGHDIIDASVSMTLARNVQDLALTGTAAINGWGNGGANHLTGNGAANLLNGESGNDLLTGGDGADTLVGGKGQDTLTGGAGDDLFVFRPGQLGHSDAKADLITDFTTGHDRIDLSSLEPVIHGKATAFTFLGTGAFDGRAGEVHIHYAGGDTFISGDIDGDGHADFQIRLTGHLDLTRADLVL